MAESSQILPGIWIALGISLGCLLGFLWGAGVRLRISQEQAVTEHRAQVWDKKVEHQRFGITDLKLRMRQNNQQVQLMRQDHRLLRQTYDRLNGELQTHWDQSVHLKTQIADQQNQVDRLQVEVDDWKTQVTKLQSKLDEGEITQEQLKEELALGLVALCEHAGEQMPAVQQILLDYPASGKATSSEQLAGLLSAQVQLLEGQVRYWQEKATQERENSAQAKIDEAPAEPEKAIEPPPPTPIRAERVEPSAVKRR